MTDVTAIILAGGLSSRMGQDKALLPIGNQLLIQHVYSSAQTCCNDIFVVTPWIERYRNVLPNSCQFVFEQPPLDDRDMHGPLVGFAQGLASVQTDWVLLLACDLPRLQSDVLQQGRQQLPHIPEVAIAFLPKHPRGWEPLCGFYRRSCLPDLLTFIELGGRSFQRWLAQHTVQEFLVPDRKMLFNCNTPADLASLNLD